MTNNFAETLALSLLGLTDMGGVIFSLSGSMANENARKEVVNYRRARGRPEKILVFGAIKWGYHGSVGEMLRITQPDENELVIESPCYKNLDEITWIVGGFKSKVEAIEKSGGAKNTVAINENIIVDFDAKGKMLGIEVLSAIKVL